jgi:hypothetical protein
MRFRSCVPAFLCLTLSLLTGCSLQSPTATPIPASVGFSGHVHGGQQPVSGATLQLYTVGTAADGSASTPLLTETVTSDARGNFNITGLYSCTSATLVYMTATGGNPGLASANPNLAMMTALGPCSSLTPSTFISINELTTVAAVYALAPYMTSASAVGSTTAHTSSLTSAFSLASQFVAPSTGQSPGIDIPSGYSAPTVQLNTLADILASCINSTGGSSRDGSLCGSLFALSTPSGANAPMDTISALLNLANNPQLNTYSLYNLITPSAPFQPIASSLPPDFRVRLAIPAAQVAIPLPAPTLTFASTTVFTNSATQTVPLQNTGSTPLTISRISLIGLNPSDFVVINPCPAILQPQASCSLQIYFSPTATGSRNAFLQINTISPASPQYITLFGIGAPAASSPAYIFLSSLLNGVTKIQTYPSSANGNASPVSTYTGSPGKYYYTLKTDGNNMLYAGTGIFNSAGYNEASEVDVFTIGVDGVITPARSLLIPDSASTGPGSFSSGLGAVDKSGRIIMERDIANNDGYSYTTFCDVYAAGASGAASPLFSVPNCNGYMAVDPAGDLFAMDLNNNIIEFPAGFNASTKPSRTIDLTAVYNYAHDPVAGPYDVTTDNAGNVYILLTGGPNEQTEILEFGPSASGSSSPIRTIAGQATQLSNPYQLVVDSNGLLYVTDEGPTSAGVVLEFGQTANGNTPPAAIAITSMSLSSIALH